MDLQFKKEIVDYFNTVLRSTLNYPEIFDISFSDRSISLLPDKTSKLLQLIKTDSTLKHNILDQIKQGLSKHNIYTEDIYFISHGTDIMVGYESVPFNTTILDTTILDMPLYSNIVSNLDEEGIDNFCKTNKHFKSICNNPMFWSEMIRFKYPEYYVEKVSGIKYNWKEIYLGIDTYVKDKIDYEKYRGSEDRIYDPFQLRTIRNYPEAFIYLLNNKLTTLSQHDLDIIIQSIYNIDVIKSILSNNIIDQDQLDIVSKEYMFNINIIKLYLNYKGTDYLGNLVKINEHDFKERIEYMIISMSSSLSIELFDFYYEYLYPNGSYTNMLGFLFLGFPNSVLVKHVLSKVPDDIPENYLMGYISNGIESYKVEILKGLWNKYKSVLKYKINQIVEIINDWHSLPQVIDYITNIFKD